MTPVSRVTDYILSEMDRVIRREILQWYFYQKRVNGARTYSQNKLPYVLVSGKVLYDKVANFL